MLHPIVRKWLCQQLSAREMDGAVQEQFLQLNEKSLAFKILKIGLAQTCIAFARKVNCSGRIFSYVTAFNFIAKLYSEAANFIL